MDLVNMASFGENRTGSRTLASFGLTSASDPLSSVPITDGFIKLNGTEIYVDVASGDRISDLVNRINLSSYAPGSEVTATVVGDSIVLDAPNSPTGIIIGEPTVGGPTDGYSDFFHVLGLTKDVSEDYQAITSGDRATINSSATPNRYATATSLGRVSLTAPLTAANLDSAPASGTGSFYVNGAEITYDTAVDTIQDIMERITESSAQVLASYDLVNDAIVLTNKTTGNIGTFVTTGDPSVVGSMTDTRNVVAALFGNVSMGASSLNTVTAGRDAVFSVNNGGDLTSRSNAFDETTHGIRGLTVDATAQSALTASYDVATNTWTNASAVTQKVTVAGDPSAAKDAVNKFVTDYNALQATIEKYTKVTNVDGKVTAAILAGSRELSDISRTLRQELYRNLGFSGSVQRLSDLGVTSSGIENVISLSNAALLESKINTDPDDVMDYFTNASTGLINRLGAFLGDSSTDVSAASGKLGIQLTTIQKQNTSLDKQIAEFERRLESQRQLLESSFIAMERAQAQYQQQGSYLQRTFGGGSK
jgi:flagellar hook-associated protein 2